MSKIKTLDALKKQLMKDLVELLTMEKEREILEAEVDKQKESGPTRRGMLEALTEAYFTKIIEIAKEEETIEDLTLKP